MFSRLSKNRFGPIGVDIGTRSVKLVQFTADGTRLVEANRQDLPAETSTDDPALDMKLSEALIQAREGRAFKGREAILCLNERQLFLHNIRVPKADQEALDRHVAQEAAGRVPFPVADAEIRYLQAADVRQGDTLMREVILMACHRPELERLLSIVEEANLVPVAVDVEPAALVRTYNSQFRREADKEARSIYVQVGHGSTSVVIAEGPDILFVKYLELGGRDFDAAVSRALQMDLPAASSLRRHNGDRRSDQQDPEIARTVAEATRPVLEKLLAELSKCVRYHSVTFRGRPLERLVLGGGEAAQPLADVLNKRLGVKCELSDPFRMYPRAGQTNRRGQWDVAAGLALRLAV